jgi:SAM-dependent methyltransferase
MTDSLQLFSRSKNSIWTDNHISQNMLAAHLDGNHDAASRNTQTIEATVEWICSEIEPDSPLLDLGCGPGLYAERFAAKNFRVTGIDISKRSIEYARQSACRKGLDICYHVQSYLDDPLPVTDKRYAAAICIYCDFGALIPSEQVRFLAAVRNSLCDSGVLIFDVFGDGLSATKTTGRTWTYHETGGFWSPYRHYLLEETVYFPDAHAWGCRTVVVSENAADKIREYITWDCCFSPERITTVLQENGFHTEKIRTRMVPKNEFTGNDVLFVKAEKIPD